MTALGILGGILWIALAILALRGVRWAYLVFVVLGFVWIPARTGFHLHRPPCETAFSFALAAFSLTNYKHVVLFCLFFLMTWVQLRRVRYALIWAALATLALGALIELEEGATGTGHCRVRDLVPDAAGAAAGAALSTLWRRRW